MSAQGRYGNNNNRNNSKGGNTNSSGGSSSSRKESILELSKYLDASVHVKCVGGRELVGILRGYDELINLVLDDTDEFMMRGPGQGDGGADTEKRKLGLVVVRGTQVSLVSPNEGREEIANPFLEEDDDDDDDEEEVET
mmetsp:Transcript_460/g.556  ORF Transcript_460/g.556 Transcript_460/m.556 type:complete len:139 (-) Transcript_460:165-581(-)|eukprot:CAMPEP_0178962684 /NCGR_PEP_ID=MMETSP0789-20121207/14515_1 /TAXON_ID=3005 /ORGANISM="Rhizosolenia setigera, Strain CCMP 1694" /LENGTH=138 /DNA_ID=CAMNT_0020646889 /DNA_START=524 /DNA_END=940 /DNA_ORIENTATION=-